VDPTVDPSAGKIDSTENDGCGDGATFDLPQPGVTTTDTPRLAMTTRASELQRM
jgi:hypothetical protein